MIPWNSFPNLSVSGFNISSPETTAYNCIAFAFEDTSRWWWPDQQMQYYWPPGVPREETLQAFEMAFASVGYTRCAGDNLENQFGKIAIYAIGNSPQHAARQARNGRWLSKLGPGVDILHSLAALEGGSYGNVACLMRRPTST